jgi:hypothetical protein
MADRGGITMNFVWEQMQIENGEPSERILIIARNIRYVHEWCRIHSINPRSPMIRVVKHFYDLRGVSGMYYVDLGTDDAELRTLIEQLKAIQTIKPLLTPNI